MKFSHLCHHIALSSSAVLNDTGLKNVAPPTAYHNELTPNIHITLVDGNTHKCWFSTAEFLKNSLKICDII